MRILGTLNSPQLILKSAPPLPSDEILSRHLFRRSVSNITPLQALQLAQAAKAMIGGGTDLFDIMGYAKNILGVDQLAIVQSGKDEGTAISVGKHIGDNVYIQMERGREETSGKVTVEVEVTPNITIESEAGQDLHKGIGVNWKWNY